MKPRRSIIRSAYKRLFAFYGPQRWWPGDSRLEIIIGAILTQNTSWSNVEKAIRNLKDNRLLSSPEKLLDIGEPALAKLIRPAGYYNVKSKRIRNFLKFLAARYGSSLRKMAHQDTGTLRRELIQVNGIGPETCDSILLYAFGRPVFVVDAYTKRVFSRHRLFLHELGYHEIQDIFLTALPPDSAIFNEYHALIVALGKEFCRPKPDCSRCPLKGI